MPDLSCSCNIELICEGAIIAGRAATIRYLEYYEERLTSVIELSDSHKAESELTVSRIILCYKGICKVGIEVQCPQKALSIEQLRNIDLATQKRVQFHDVSIQSGFMHRDTASLTVAKFHFVVCARGDAVLTSFPVLVQLLAASGTCQGAPRF